MHPCLRLGSLIGAMVLALSTAAAQDDVPGRVLDLEGRPVPGARIYEMTGAKESRDPPLSTTDAAGRFSIPRAKLGAPLHARCEGFGPTFSQRFAAPPPGGEPLTLRFTELGRDLTGIALDPDGKPAAGAEIRVAGGKKPANRGEMDVAPPFVAIAGADGRFRIAGVSRRQLVVFAKLAGSPMWRGGVPRSEAGDTYELRVGFAAGARVEGRVVDAESRPVAGARVRTSIEGEESSATTDAAGVFALEGLRAGEAEFSAFSEAHGDAQWTTTLEPGAKTSWSPTLVAARTVRVRVVDAESRPVPGRRVRLQTSEGWTPAAEIRLEQTSDAEGRVRFIVERGRPIADGFAGDSVHTPDAAHAELTLKDHPAAGAPVFVTGRFVVGPGARRPESVVISVYGGSISRETPVGEDGRFRAGPLRAGLTYCSCSSRSTSVRQSVSLGDRRTVPGETWDLGDVDWAPSGSIVATLTNGEVSAAPYALGGYLVARSEDRRFSASAPFVDGKATLDLPPSTYVVRLQGRPELVPVARRVVVASGATVAVPLPTDKGALRLLSLQLPENASPGAAARATLYDTSGIPVAETTVNPGPERVVGMVVRLPVGAFVLRAVCGDRAAETPFVVAADDREPFVISLR